MTRHLLAVVVALACIPAAQAAITEIHNMSVDGSSDASYTGGTFTWHTSDLAGQYNTLTLLQGEDKTNFPGMTGNVDLTITLDRFINFGTKLSDKAYFQEGIVDLQFDYIAPDNTVTSRRLRGKIAEASVEVTSANDAESSITGIINFDTHDSTWGIESLPAEWPASGLSTGIALTIAIGANLSDFMVGNPDADSVWRNANFPEFAVYETQVSFVPEQRPIPEPAALALLGIGSVALLRRRK